MLKKIVERQWQGK